MNYSRVAEAFFGAPWAILPEKLQQIGDILRARVAPPGGEGSLLQGVSSDEVQRLRAAHEEARTRAAARSTKVVAVLPLLGPIFQRANLFTEVSGGTSLQQFAGTFRAALADPAVNTIVLDVDSPGGEVFGTPEMADEIFAARGQKRIVAVANSLAASAAYWIASAAEELVMTPSGQVGSIGVFALHEDFSKMEEMQGVKSTLVSAGKYKVEGNPLEPLSADARAAIQKQVDNYYGMFVKAVARQRNAKVSDVRGGYGEGRLVGASEAQAAGLVDRIATLEETLAWVGAARTAAIQANLERERLGIEGIT
jgi:signal peptide peptidase SppA